MIWNFNSFCESIKIDEPHTMSELLEKMSVVEQSILDEIKAELINSVDMIDSGISIDDINTNRKFIDYLENNNLTKSKLENTKDYETFLISPLKYILLYKSENSQLDNPEMMVLSTYNTTEQKWNSIKVYKINGDFRNFYNALSNKTVEITQGENKYIYQTSNKNEYDLMNQQETDEFPKYIRTEDLIKLMNKHQS